MENLNKLTQQLHEDLERISALRTKGLKAYFETLNRQQKKRKALKFIEEVANGKATKPFEN